MDIFFYIAYFFILIVYPTALFFDWIEHIPTEYLSAIVFLLVFLVVYDFFKKKQKRGKGAITSFFSQDFLAIILGLVFFVFIVGYQFYFFVSGKAAKEMAVIEQENKNVESSQENIYDKIKKESRLAPVIISPEMVPQPLLEQPPQKTNEQVLPAQETPQPKKEAVKQPIQSQPIQTNSYPTPTPQNAQPPRSNVPNILK